MKVLSTTSLNPPFRQMAAMARMSETAIMGLVGVSTNTALVWGVTAASTAPRSEVSTKDTVMPMRLRILVSSRKVPP